MAIGRPVLSASVAVTGTVLTVLAQPLVAYAKVHREAGAGSVRSHELRLKSEGAIWVPCERGRRDLW